MTEERWNNARTVWAMALAAALILLGSFTPWFDARLDGQPLDVEALLGLGPYRVLVGVGGAAIAAIAAALWFVRRPVASGLVRAATALAALVPLLFAGGNWAMLASDATLAQHRPEVAERFSLTPGWGLVTLSVGVVLAVGGALLRPTLERVAVGQAVVTRPHDARPVGRDELTPGEYLVDGRPDWWDGRAWANPSPELPAG